jgi:hypothetical protein
MTTFSQSFICHDTTYPFENLKNTFKSSGLDVLSTNVPSKMISQRFNQPWITGDLKWLSRRKDRAFKQYRTTHPTRNYLIYKDLKMPYMCSANQDMRSMYTA